MVTRKPLRQNWYDAPINAPDYHISFTITWGHTARILIYTYNLNAFNRLEQKKDDIESICGFHLDWYSSRKSSVQKRIIHSREIDYYAAEKQVECFDWFIECFDKLKAALDTCDPYKISEYGSYRDEV